MSLPKITLSWQKSPTVQKDQQVTLFPQDTCGYELHWYEEPPPIDEGLPPQLINFLASVFCDYGKLSFISDELGEKITVVICLKLLNASL